MHVWAKAAILGVPLLACILTNASAQAIDPEDAWAREDILRLEATLGGGMLTVQVTTRAPLDDFGNHFIEVFLDTDQNSLTGNVRPGGVGGVEYRIACLTGILTSFDLHRQPVVEGADEQSTDFADIPGASGTVNGNTLTLQLPVSAIGGAGAVDVFALAHEGGNPTFIRGNGDRCPDAGALSTSTGTVVVRRPAAPIDATFDDPPGDHTGGGDLTGVRFRTFGDQFQIILSFAAPPDPTSLLADLSVHVTLDSDRSLLTGFRSMGAAIATWGGDVELLFSMSSGVAYSAQLLLGVMAGSTVPFGAPYSDGRWHVEDNRLVLTASLSVFDARFLLASGAFDRGAPGTVERRPTDGRMIGTVAAGALTATTYDELPGESRALDLERRQILEPFQWDPAQTVSEADPQEFGPVSGIDLVQVDAAVIEQHLVVKGTLTRWDATAVENGFWILLDTDADGATGTPFSNEHEPGSPAIGVDYGLFVYSRDEFTYVGYYADLIRPDGKVEPHDAWLEVRPSSQGPASFTVTVPFASLGQPGPAVHGFLATTNDFVMYATGQLYDVAPPSPLVVAAEAETATFRDVALQDGWNLVSVPLQPADGRTEAVFPGVRSEAFAYGDGYEQADVLEVGKGYWLKVEGVQTQRVHGTVPPQQQIAVRAGWNLIGAFDEAVAAASVASTPAGIIASPFYGYGERYEAATTLQPGRGYWLKADQDGTLQGGTGAGKAASVVGAGALSPAWVRLVVEDRRGRSATLYLASTAAADLAYFDLPPAPPPGVFDVRFGSGRFVEQLGPAQEVRLAGVVDPVRIRVENLPGRVLRVRGGAGRVDAALEEGISLEIPEAVTRFVVVAEEVDLPRPFAMEPNWPNPFHAETVVSFTLPEAGRVRLVVYDALGRRVAELVAGPLEAGRHQVVFDGQAHASGVYLCVMEAERFRAVQRMVLLK